MGISLKGFGDAAGSGTGASVSGISALPPQAAEVRLPAPVTGPTGPEAGPTYTLSNPNAYGTEANDYFGKSVSSSASYTIVAAPQEDDPSWSVSASGRVYIFDGTTGSLLHTLDNPNPYGTTASDKFGDSVATSGNYSIVGAQYEDDAGGIDSGKAYIFDNTTGNLLHTLNNPNAYNTSAGDRFGGSVAISGNYSVVGALGEDDAAGNTSGKAYIFNNTTGSLLHTLDNPNPFGTSANDWFGSFVAITDNYAIITAALEDDAGGTNSGKAYIYDNTTGNLLHTIDNPNAYSTSAWDRFGNNVSAFGNKCIIGAPFEGDAAGTSSGKAYIFDCATGNLLSTLDNPNAYGTSANDYFGRYVSISTTYAIVGGNEVDAGGTASGKAYIFDNTTGSLLYTLDNPNAYGTSANDYFSTAVSINDSYAVVGAYGEDYTGGINSGKAYIYNL